MSSDDLRRCAPSVFADHARPGVSSRYTFVSTAQVVALLSAEGWEPVKASEQRVRLESRVGFQMHEIRFTRRADLEAGPFDVETGSKTSGFTFYLAGLNSNDRL